MISLRLKDEQLERLQHAARRFGRSPSETAALLLEESLRQREHPFIEFRDSIAGREAYIQGTRLSIWQIVELAREFDGDVVALTAAYLEILEIQVRAALAYADRYSSEVNAAIADNEWATEHLLPLTPGFEVVEVDASPT